MKRYNTPHRSRVVKTRMTEEEYAEFAQRLSAYHMSQAEFIRQAIIGAAMPLYKKLDILKSKILNCCTGFTSISIFDCPLAVSKHKNQSLSTNLYQNRENS